MFFESYFESGREFLFSRRDKGKETTKINASENAIV